MAKTSQKRFVRYDKDQAGCMWALISIFDRHGRNTRRLLSDRKHQSKQVGGYSTSKRHVLKNSDGGSREICVGEERNTLTADDTKTSIKKLINGEVFCKQDQNTQTLTSDTEAKQEPKSLTKKNPKRRSKTSKSCSDIHFELDPARNLGTEEFCFKNLDAEALIKDLYQQIHLKNATCMKHERVNDIDIDEKFVEAVKTFVNRRFADGKHLPEDWETNHSKEFLDGLQTLECDKDLILKLLKDPRSPLEEDQNPTSLPRSNTVDGKQHKFFRRRSRSQERVPLKEDDNSKTSNTIVLLKPGPARAQSSEAKTNRSSTLPSDYSKVSKVQAEKVASQFSFTEIKRKLKHAIRKERHRFPSDGDITQKVHSENHYSGNSEKAFGGEKTAWNSPNRNHFLSEKFTKPTNGIKGCKPKDVDIITGGKTFENPNQKVSNIYIEAKKHLLEMLSNEEEETEDLSGPPLPETLGRVLSFPDHSFSPVCSPGGDDEREFVTAKERFSSYSNSDAIKQETDDLIKENQKDTAQCCDSTADVLGECNGSCTLGEPSYSMKHEKISGDIVEVVETTAVDLEKESEMETLAEQYSSSVIQDDQSQDLNEVYDRDGSAECLKLDNFDQDQFQSSPLGSPPSSSSTKHDKSVDNTNEKMERSSPVSVLEPSLFTEDDVSPASIKFVPESAAALPIKPRHFDFEDHLCSSPNQEMCIRGGMEDMETSFEYVEAVLLASDLNWEDFLSRWLSSDHILDASLFDEVVLFSNRPQYDQKLFFDCTNDILREICEEYLGFFSYSPRASCVRHNIERLPRGKDLIDEVWKRVELHLQPPAYTLDEIVRNDMDIKGSWMDLSFDSENISLEVGETILDELLEDVIMSFANEDPEQVHQDPLTHSIEGTMVLSNDI